MLNTITKLGIFLTLIGGLVLVGCSSSEETAKKSEPPPQPSATEITQMELSNLKTENESLKKQISKLEQGNRSTIAHAAELETQMAELKEKLATPPPPPTKPSVSNFQESYDQALKLYRSKNYQESASLFQMLLDTGIPVELQDNCYYWLGECSYGEKRYGDAIELFKKVFTFKISEKKDDAQIMIANSYLTMGNKTKAKEEYERLIKKFPASPFVKRAKERLGKL